MAASFTLPNGGPTLNRIGYGAMQLPGRGVWGPPRDHGAALAVLRAAVEAGVDHIDTADFYGPHVSNALIREALSPYPDGLVITTKVGFLRGPDKSWNPAHSAEALTQAVHDNLKSLGAERLDIVNLRMGLAGGGTSEESVEAPLEALTRLQAQGLIAHVGLSNVTPAQVEEGRRLAPIVCVQNLYNLANRGDDALIDDLAEAGIAYTPYFPLGGFTPLQSDALSEVARALDATPQQTALAWLLQRSPNILLSPGTSSVAHLRENLAAAELKLPPDAVAKLNAIAG